MNNYELVIYKNTKGLSKIAAFDLDHTIIEPRAGKIFPKNYSDWILLPGMKQKLNRLYNNGYKIVIFTNQSGNNFDPDKFRKKIHSIKKELGIPIQVFVCIGYGYCRKPSIGMWHLLLLNNNGVNIDMNRSFYSGDAAGRPGDFSDTDKKFAENIGIKFIPA